MAATEQVLTQALKVSTAHGISHAMATKSRLMKVMYLIAFTIFLGLFIYYGILLIVKLRTSNWTRDYAYDAEKFKFPDIYFCPTNPVSGSIPYVLSDSEAQQVNREMESASELFDNIGISWEGRSIDLKEIFVMRTMREKIFQNFLTQTHAQTFIQIFKRFGVTAESTITTDMSLNHPTYIKCFQPFVDAKLMQDVTLQNSQLNIILLADSYSSEHEQLNYSGAAIDPIRAGGDKPRYVHEWKPTKFAQDMPATGFHMIIVPPRTYPSDFHETKLILNPGHAYDVRLKMDTYEFDSKLVESNCETKIKQVMYKDIPYYFNYSWSSCYHREKTQWMVDNYGCIPPNFPVLIEFNNYPRCLNLAEMPIEKLQKLTKWLNSPDADQSEDVARRKCRKKRPPKFAQYIADYTFASWPGYGDYAVNYFSNIDENKNFSERFMPAKWKLITLAKRIEAGKATKQMKRTFWNYLSQNLLQVTLSVEKSTSTKITLQPAYSLEQFLADAGGLLGLYIGCSLLTLLEMVELMYSLISGFLLVSSKKQPTQADGEGSVFNGESGNQQETWELKGDEAADV